MKHLVSGTVIAAAIRREIPGIGVEAAATVNTIHTCRWSTWIDTGTVVVFAKRIMTPLPHIAVHVVESPSVWLLLPNWFGELATSLLNRAARRDEIAPSLLGRLL